MGQTIQQEETRFRSWRLIRALLYFSLSAFFFYVLYLRYWKWRDCIKAAVSSCITPDGANLIAGGLFWALPAAFFAVLGARLILKSRSDPGRHGVCSPGNTDAAQ